MSDSQLNNNPSADCINDNTELNSKLSLFDTCIATNDLPLLSHYLCGYECRLVGSKSKLYVVRLDVYVNQVEQMPCITSDGLPIVYIDPHTKMIDEESEYVNNNVQSYEANKIEWERVQTIIDEHFDILFVNHSNLVAISAEQVNRRVVVKFTVVCKGYIPYEETVLPKSICGANTMTVEGWFSFCKPIFPGCDIAPVNSCNLEGFEEMGNEPLCTFGNIGGFVRTESKIYGVTAGHLFEGCRRGSPVMHSTALSRLYKYLKSRAVLASDFDALRRYHGFKYGLEKACRMADATVEDLIKYVNLGSSIQELGRLVEFTTGMPKLALNTKDYSVDVALIEMSMEHYPIDETTKYVCFPTGDIISAPRMELSVTNGIVDRCNIFDDTSHSVDNEIEVHGMGARTSIDLYLKLRPSKDKAYIRKWSKTPNTEPIFGTYHASSFDTKKNLSIQPGDSGMWFWTSEDKIVGVGIGYLECNQCDKSIILPMKTVAGAIEYMLSKL
jgi:hypothetical protein